MEIEFEREKNSRSGTRLEVYSVMIPKLSAELARQTAVSRPRVEVSVPCSVVSCQPAYGSPMSWHPASFTLEFRQLTLFSCGRMLAGRHMRLCVTACRKTGVMERAGLDRLDRSDRRRGFPDRTWRPGRATRLPSVRG